MPQDGFLIRRTVNNHAGLVFKPQDTANTPQDWHLDPEDGVNIPQDGFLIRRK